jgi:hypothetical protein
MRHPDGTGTHPISISLFSLFTFTSFPGLFAVGRFGTTTFPSGSDRDVDAFVLVVLVVPHAFAV